MAIALSLQNEPVSIGDNILAAKDDKGRLVLIIDPTKDFGKKEGGKLNKVAGTPGGFMTLPGTTLKLNLYLGINKSI